MIQIIEKINENGSHWYISFDGYNPTDEESVLCQNEHQAIKLHRLINDYIRKYWSREVLSKDEAN